MEIENYSTEKMIAERNNSEQALQSMKIVDYEKIFNIIQEKNLHNCDIGLREDWSCTAAELIEDNITCEKEYFYGKSTWATPVLMDEEGNIYECWKFIPRESQMSFKIPLWFRLSMINRCLQEKEAPKELIEKTTKIIGKTKKMETILSEMSNTKIVNAVYDRLSDIIEEVQTIEKRLRNDEYN